MNGRAAVYAARWTESVHLLQTSLCLGPHLLSRLIAKLWQTNFSSGCVCACVCVCVEVKKNVFTHLQQNRYVQEKEMSWQAELLLFTTS